MCRFYSILSYTPKNINIPLFIDRYVRITTGNFASVRATLCFFDETMTEFTSSRNKLRRRNEKDLSSTPSLAEPDPDHGGSSSQPNT